MLLLLLISILIIIIIIIIIIYMKIWISYWLLSHNTDFEIACTSLFRKLLHFALLHYALEKLFQFALKDYYIFRWKFYYILRQCYYNFALVLHFAAILITFCVNVTFCGDYYILRRNKRPHCPPWDPKKIDKKGEILLRASNFRKKFIPGIFPLTKENISLQCRISVSHAVKGT